MKVLVNLILYCSLFLEISAQSVLTYHKVEIPITKQQDHTDLQDLGLSIICGSEHKHTQNEEHIILVLSQTDLDNLKKQKISYQIVEENYSKKIEERNKAALPVAKRDLADLKRNQVKRGVDVGQDLGCIEQDWPIPANFKLGSMGGMLTYTELLTELDEMAMKYPSLISSRASASATLTSIEGRDIQYVRISDNPTVSESEPQVLYTGLHHAREPVSMMNMIFYMWYLLENYSTDPDIKRLIDHTELLFIPCVNPDGYLHNQSTNPNGGGFWRKNRRVNAGGTIGVDLNRNYGYQWGINNGGSSNTPSSDVYHGTSAFSEPETQIIKEFVEARNIITAFNNHTSGDLHLYPWGYTPDASPDDVLFHEMTEQMCWYNRYFYGRGNTTIYPVAGEADDWFYGEETTKDRIFAWTPEVGSNGFWPSPSLVVPQCQREMRMNLQVAAMASNYGVLNDLTQVNLSSLNPTIDFSIQHLSSVPGTFTINITAVSPYIQSISQPTLTTAVMSDDEFETISTSLQLDPATPSRSNISYTVTVSNGTYDIFTRTYSKRYTPGVMFSEAFNNGNQWNLGSWDIEPKEGYIADGSLTDSDTGDSPSGTITASSNAIDLTASAGSVLEYFTRWDIAWNFDYVQVQLSTDESTWTDLCGTYTKMGTADGFFNTDQPSGDPLYDGIQEEWVREEFDISAYDGEPSVYIRFLHYGDDGRTQRDGIYIDDLSIYATAAAHCSDGIQNVDETGIDCGGLDCLACPTCTDGIQNGNETDIDCGGPDCPACPLCETVTLDITVDDYPNETTWEITDENNGLVINGGNYAGQTSGATVTETMCLLDGCYTFTIYDSFGDGICCTEGNGSYTLRNAAGDILASGGVFQNSDTTPFCIEIEEEDCPVDITLTMYPVIDSTYYASNAIYSNGTVNNAYDISLSAGKLVELKPDFEVILGAKFHALIGGCPQ